MASCYGRGDMILPLTKQAQSGEEEGHRPILGLENDGSIMAAILKIRENALYSSYIFYTVANYGHCVQNKLILTEEGVLHLSYPLV